MSSKFKNVSHCIFDMDGLLLDTEILYTVMTQSIIDRFAGPRNFYTWDIQIQMLSIPMIEEGRKIKEIFNLPITPEEYVEMMKQLIPIYMRNCNKCEGAERLIKHLYANKIPICVATSSAKESFDVKSSNHKEFFKLFHHIILGEDVENGKPAPDIFLLAAKRFDDGVKAENCLVFEDSPNGVRAAKLAGMQSIMVTNPNTPENQRSEATQVLLSLNDFKPEEFGLPKW